MEKPVKIRRPDPGPAEPPAPEAPPWEVPKMGGIEAGKPAVWRVTENELDDLASWLLPLLKERHSHLNESAVYHMLKRSIGERDKIFSRTLDCVGLWTVTSGNALDPFPKVVEEFFRSREKRVPTTEHPLAEQQVELHCYIRDYAKSLKASEFIYGRDSDASLTHIRQAMQDSRKGSELKQQTIYRARFE